MFALPGNLVPMNPRVSLPFLAAVLLLLCPSLGRADEAVGAASRALAGFFQAEWEWTLASEPTRASGLGDRRFNDRWPDESLAAIGERHAHEVAALERLRAGVDRAALPAADQLNYDLFVQRLETRVAGHRFRWFLCPLNQRGGVQTNDELADVLRFERVKDYEDWCARLEGFPARLAQTTALLREGIRARVLLPKVVMARVPAQIARQVVAQPEDSPFFRPLRQFPAGIGAEDRARLTERARRAVAQGVVPGFAEFGRFFETEYLPACFDEVGVWQIPDGAEAYAYFARLHTTTSLTPARIHEIGLGEVARIRAAMDVTMRQVGWTGTRAEFFQHLRTDPKFFYATGGELLDAYKTLAKTVDPLLVKLFKILPRTPYGVEPIPEKIAPDTTTAYYRQPAADGSRAGTYFVNLYQPGTRPKWEMTALTLHESVPGHHLQIARAMEQGSAPAFRRFTQYTAYVEGWGLYAESLGEEMGLYADPYARFGELTYEMWRAVRLVVDTGMHHHHWSRQQAIDYFMDNASRSELDITNEVDRYIAWPGQALAYKIGQLKIKELRARASAALGERFDVREFHEAVLSDGALPLEVLERRVDGWIATQM